MPLWTLLDVTEGQQAYVPAAAPAAKGSEQRSSGGNVRGAKSIWRARSNAFVEWAKTMQVEMSGGGPEGSKEASTNSGVDASTIAAVGSSGSGVAGSATPSGPSVAWAPHTDTLSPEGTQFQYAPVGEVTRDYLSEVARDCVAWVASLVSLSLCTIIFPRHCRVRCCMWPPKSGNGTTCFFRCPVILPECLSTWVCILLSVCPHLVGYLLPHNSLAGQSSGSGPSRR